MKSILSLSILTTGCGIIIGNPGNPADGSGDTAEFVQTIDYDIPEGVSGYSLSNQNFPDGIFDDSAKRIDQTIDRVNQMIVRLNADAVAATGDFTGKGPDGRISGTIVDISDSSDLYQYRAIICHDSRAFQVVEWSAATGSVHTYRDQSIDPLDARRKIDAISEILYTKGTKSSIDVWLTATPPQAVPGADGPKIADHTSGTYQDGVYTLAAIHNWYGDAATIQEEGDEYFVGQFDDAGVGENLTYNIFQPNCSSVVFDDSAVEHTWCGGRKIPNGQPYSADERVAAATRLKGIAVPTKATLKAPALPTDLTCP